MIRTNKLRTQNITKIAFNGFISKNQPADYIFACTSYTVGGNGNKIAKNNWFENTDINGK